MRHDGQFLLESDDESLEFVDLLPGLSQLLLELGDLLLKLPLFLLQFLATLQVRGSRYNREIIVTVRPLCVQTLLLPRLILTRGCIVFVGMKYYDLAHFVMS